MQATSRFMLPNEVMSQGKNNTAQFTHVSLSFVFNGINLQLPRKIHVANKYCFIIYVKEVWSCFFMKKKLNMTKPGIIWQ